MRWASGPGAGRVLAVGVRSARRRVAWKDLFREANLRCRAHGVDLSAHAHLLRHTFAVVTLEQLQRGHISTLAELNSEQRGHYTRIFGDPLDWVRRRLGHRSVVTTQTYLHALAELEMVTRMALVMEAHLRLESCAGFRCRRPAARDLRGP